MEVFSIAQCKAFLECEAFRLSRTALPVHLGKLCAALGLVVSYRDDLKKPSAYLVRTGDDWRRATVLLPSVGRGSRYQRFCLGHEIAHLLLFRQFELPPEGDRSYWQVEELCDEFARRLLVPDSVVEEYYAPTQPEAILESSYKLCAAAQVPWSQAAKRIGEYRGNVFFFRVGGGAEHGLKILASTLANLNEPETLIRDDTELARDLQKVRAGRSGREPIYLSARRLQESGIPSLLKCREGAASIRAGEGSSVQVTVLT